MKVVTEWLYGAKLESEIPIFLLIWHRYRSPTASPDNNTVEYFRLANESGDWPFTCEYIQRGEFEEGLPCNEAGYIKYTFASDEDYMEFCLRWL